MDSFSTMFQTWFGVLTSPNEETFEIEKQRPETTFSKAIIWIVIATVIATLFGILQAFIGFATASSMGMFDQVLNDPNIPPEFREMASQFFSGGGLVTMAGVGLVFSFVSTIVSFIIGAVILHLLAILLGGKGDIGTFAYLRATYLAPLAIVKSILGLVPVLGGCLYFASLLYQIVLAYFATKVNYGLSSGKAIIVVIIPTLLVIVFVACFAFLFFSAAVTAGA